MLTVYNSSKDPFYNLALEEYIFMRYQEDDIFYLWQDRPAVIAGSYQNICREVNIKSLMDRNIPVLRRITGGGTVYHDLGNINYTLIRHAGENPDYDMCLEPVIRALNALGIPAGKNRSCDISIGSQKISGSAQRMVRNRILHHGTLLFASDLALLDEITTHHKNECFQSHGTKSAVCPVTNISEHLSEAMTLEEFQEKLLAEVLHPDTKRIHLGMSQVAEVLQLRDKKYHSWEWIWGQTPAFTYEKKGMYRGKPIMVSYRAKKGIICGFALQSEWVRESEAEMLFQGARLDPVGFYESCEKLGGEYADQLMELIM